MRSLCAAGLIAMTLPPGPALAAERLTLGSDQVVIDGKNVFVNGQKVSCKDLSDTIHEDWGGVVFDQNCVKRTIRIIPVSPVRKSPAAGFHRLYIHDECIGENRVQPDTCLHLRRHEKSFTFGGKKGTVYYVTLRVRGLFEPTTIEGGETPDPAHPWFKAGGRDVKPDYSQWHIDVSAPKQSYTLNHYPATSHTIYKEDFEATIPIAAGATVLVQTIDSNDREIDNGAPNSGINAGRQQILEGINDAPLAGQQLRLDVVRVEAR